ncbi:MOSC domain-containing protein [Jackrogersella minutella]|nr:MOSC domain-containing protein [Jackrogersella minutella]
MGQKIKITELYIYPIKSLRPLSVGTAQLRREGLRFDRRFMLLKAEADGTYKNIQTAYFPECTLFSQALDLETRHVVVEYRVPARPPAEQRGQLRVPLDPSTDGVAAVAVKLFGSDTVAYRVGGAYDDWFSACLGYRAALVYIGDNRRRVLAHAPPSGRPQPSGQSWLSSLMSAAYQWSSGGGEAAEDAVLTFNEAAPFLLTSRASLRDVSARLPEGEDMDMVRFRPNIVVDLVSDDDDDDDEQSATLTAWEEDFWAELLIRNTHRLALTANCARCISINIDYSTGRPGTGEAGSVLKKLMKDRRVDAGNKWSPIFGRYAFLLPPTAPPTPASDADGGLGRVTDLVADVAVGDEVKVTKRIIERDVWAWPK